MAQRVTTSTMDGKSGKTSAKLVTASPRLARTETNKTGRGKPQ